MGFFKRKKDEEAKIQLEREALDKLNRNNLLGFEIPDDSTSNDEWQISGKTRAPHTITAEELNSKSPRGKKESPNADSVVEEIPMAKTEETPDSPADFLYQKMMRSRAENAENVIAAAEVEEQPKDKAGDIPQDIPPENPVTQTYVPLDINAAIDDLKNSAGLNPNENKKDGIAAVTKDSPSIPESSEELPGDLPTAQPTSKTDITVANSPTANEEQGETLVERCNAYLEDDSGPTKMDTEKYRLESVESILEGLEARATERANQKFNSTPSSSTPPRSKTNDSPIIPKPKEPSNPASTGNTVIFASPVSQPDANNNRSQPEEKKAKHIYTAPSPGSTTPNSDSNDFSSTRIITDISSHSSPIDVYSSGKTSVFPIVEPIVAPSNNQPGNSEGTEVPEKNDEPVHFEDYHTIADRPRILNSLLKKKKVFTLKLILSLIVFIPALLTLTPISNSLFSSQNTVNIIDFIICLLLAIINFNTLSGITTLFNNKAKLSLPVALSIISATIFSIINLIFKSDFVGFSAVVAVSLLSYNLANRNFYSKTIKNFNLIANGEFKKSVSIIKNKNATKTIVGNSIDGSALVCYGGETTNIHSFLRYTHCQNPASEKIQKLSLISIIIGVGLALASLFLNSGKGMFSIYIFTASVCFSAIPSVYHIVSLTINCANRRLNHYDAMITGYHAADELELCNAIAISSDELFPKGTIRLVDMKLLSPNPIDQSMLDAEAIASAIHSPLAGIFKQMDTSNAYEIPNQEVDTVIYEEKMGISGWVNDRRVFVGNRDLLIAHGFAGLPPAELDKKIMRKGYFPVYIASNNILCALLVVKYEPDEDIIYEMQRLANTGTTIIVNNCDPNINANMLTDYFELYSDTIFVMSKQGSDYYKALTVHKEHRRAGAAYKSRVEGLLASLTASINIKKYISRMTAFYICSIVFGLLALTTLIFTSLSSFITPLNIILVQLLLTAITLLPTILRKP